MNVVLIGFSGSGKSTVGPLLAGRLGWQFIDTDAEVVRVAGKQIHRIFAEDGEAAFRRLESETVRGALGRGARVVAVGGGAVVDPVNRKMVRDGNLVVLLEAGVDTLLGRLAEGAAREPRPMLGLGVGERDGAIPTPSSPVSDPRSRIEALKAVREPIYREAAHLVVSTEGIEPEEVARQIAAALMKAVRDGTVAGEAAS